MLRIPFMDYRKIMPRDVTRRLVPFIAIFGVVLLQYALFFHKRLPAHDALFSFEMFSNLYTSLLYNQEIPLWLPYYNYGVPNIYSLLYVAPTSFIVAVVGLLAKSESVLTLFYSSILLEEFVFLVGVYFLARRLYTNIRVAWFVTLSCAMTTFPLWQIYFDFRLYVWLPYLLYFAIKFADKGDINYLFVLGSVLILSMVGQAGYFLPMIGIYVGIFLLTYVWANNKSFRFVELSSISRPRTLASLAVLALLSGLFGWLQYHQFDDLSLYVPGREFNSLNVPRDVFLSYGFNPDIRKFFEFLYAVPSNIDTRFFIGYLPLVFVLYALVSVGMRKYISFLAVAIFIVALACSQLTPIAPMLYDIIHPIRVYRHIGLLLGVAKLMLVFIAGFGLEHFLSRLGRTRFSMPWWRWKRRAFIIIATTVLSAIVILDIFFSGALPYATYNIPFISSQQLHYVSFAVLALLILLLIGRASVNLKYLALIIIVLHSFEMLSYQNYLYSLPDVYRPTVNTSIFNARPITYQPMRAREIPPEISELDAKVNAGAIYRIHDSWLNFDPCFPRWRSEFRTKAVDRMLHAWYPADSKSMVWPSNTESSLWPVLGCDAPKLRFIATPDAERFSNGANSLVIADINRTMFDREYIAIPLKGEESFVRGVSFSILAKISFANAARKYGPSDISLISQSDSEGSAPKWFFYIKKISPGTVSLAWHAWDASLGHQIDAVSDQFAIDGGVHQVGLIKDGGNYTFMLDGVPIGAFKFAYPLSIPRSDINLGGVKDKVKQPFPGTIDEVAVYDFGLPLGNIRELFNDGLVADVSPKGRGHLRGYWKNGGAQRWVDLSGFGHDGVIVDIADETSVPVVNHAQTLREAEVFLQSNHYSDDVVLRCTDESPKPCLFLVKPSRVAAAVPIEVREMSNNRVRLGINAHNEGGWLIYADSWHRGWQAFVDGKRTDILEADLGFKAVRLEPGEHEVFFRFSSPSYANVVYVLYMLLSSLMLLAVLFYMMLTGRKPNEGRVLL